MDLTSPAFDHEGVIPSKYTCDGNDVIPPLEMADVPSKAKSLALIVEDPDVPTSVRPDGMWDHWLVWNIDPTASTIEEGQTPDGVVGKNTGGDDGYMGPCPPDKEHRYFFRLYALDVDDLGLGTGAKKDDLLQAMQGHILKEAVLMGRYDRS
jgi:hypothetical protein